MGNLSPLAKEDNAITQQNGLVNVVGDEEDRGAQGLLNATELALEVSADQRVEGSEGFIHQEDVGTVCQCSCDADALALAARKLRGIALCH